MRPAPSAALVGTLCYLLACLLWGLNIPLIAALLRHFDPVWMSVIRYAIVAAVLGAWVVAALGPASLRTPIPPARVAAMSAVVAAFLLLLNVGLRHTDPITAAAVIAGSPVYVALVSRVMTGAPLADGFWGATLLTVAGAAIAVHGRADAAGHGLSLRGGELLLVASVGCWTAYSILAQRWFSADTPQLRRTYLSSLGAVPWLLASWAIARVAGWTGPPNLQPTAGALGILVFSAVFCTALATVAWNTGVARIGIAAGGLWQNTVPVFAVLSTLVLFGVVPTAGQVAGGGVVLAGVLYMQWHTLRGARRAAAGAAAR
jgi:drug/metabolite transporter (DMT)-like permease